MTDAYIYDYVKTPRGRGKPNGSLHEVTPIDLLTQILKALKDNNVAVQLEAARAAVRLFQAHPDLKQHLSREERTEIEAILAHHKELDLLQHLQEHG